MTTDVDLFKVIGVSVCTVFDSVHLKQYYFYLQFNHFIVV